MDKTSAATTTPTSTKGKMDIDKLRWLVLLTVMVGTFLGRLDQTIVNLALPKIMDDFSITVAEAGWIATAYILANAVFVPVWGKLGDSIGRKKVYLWGFMLFIVGSILAGLSWDISSMIVFRVIQAIAGSADYPTAMAIIAVTFRDGKERAEALGIWSAAFAASAVVGPLVGGPLIDMFGWRSVFLINLPVGLVGLVMAIMFVEESASEKKTTRFDWAGAITLGIALSALVLVLDKGLEWGWTSLESAICYATMLAFGALFIRIESKHPEPIVDLSFFSHPTFVSVLGNNFIVFLGMMGSMFIIPTFVQTFLGYDATQTGYLFLPMAAGMMVAAPLGSRLVGKVEPKYVIMVSTLGAALALYLFTGLDARSGPLDIAVPVLLMAFSMGLAMPQRTTLITSTVPAEEVGVASSALALVRNIAGAFGIAIFATILKNSVENNVLEIASNTVVNSASPAVLQQVVALTILKAQIDAYHMVFITSAAILVVGAVLALTINVKETKAGKEIFIE